MQPKQNPFLIKMVALASGGVRNNCCYCFFFVPKKTASHSTGNHPPCELRNIPLAPYHIRRIFFPIRESYGTIAENLDAHNGHNINSAIFAATTKVDDPKWNAESDPVDIRIDSASLRGHAAEERFLAFEHCTQMIQAK
jgi:hypothetical protein